MIFGRRRENSIATFLCAAVATIFAAPIFFGGCVKFESNASTSQPVAETSTECADSEEEQMHFQWKWCSPDQVAGGEIETVCYGTLFYQDMIFDSIKFENIANAKKQCAFSIGGGLPKTLAGCTTAVAAKYQNVFGLPTESTFTICARTDGKTAVSGNYWSSDFSAVEP